MTILQLLRQLFQPRCVWRDPRRCLGCPDGRKSTYRKQTEIRLSLFNKDQAFPSQKITNNLLFSQKQLSLSLSLSKKKRERQRKPSSSEKVRVVRQWVANFPSFSVSRTKVSLRGSWLKSSISLVHCAASPTSAFAPGNDAKAKNHLRFTLRKVS